MAIGGARTKVEEAEQIKTCPEVLVSVGPSHGTYSTTLPREQDLHPLALWNQKYTAEDSIGIKTMRL